MTKPVPLTELADVNSETLNKGDLVDISGITFDNAVPWEHRAAYILKAVKNPYCFRVGDMVVRPEFAEGAPPLKDMLTVFLLHKKNGL